MSMSRTSSALSLFLMKPPVQSNVSSTNSSPGLTQQAMGMSGCQRLWMFSFSVGDLLRSTLIRVSAMACSLEGVGNERVESRACAGAAAQLSHREIRLDALLVGVGAGGLMHQAAALDDEQPIRHVHGEREHL